MMECLGTACDMSHEVWQLHPPFSNKFWIYQFALSKTGHPLLFFYDTCIEIIVRNYNMSPPSKSPPRLLFLVIWILQLLNIICHVSSWPINIWYKLLFCRNLFLVLCTRSVGLELIRFELDWDEPYMSRVCVELIKFGWVRLWALCLFRMI